MALSRRRSPPTFIKTFGLRTPLSRNRELFPAARMTAFLTTGLDCIPAGVVFAMFIAVAEFILWYCVVIFRKRKKSKRSRFWRFKKGKNCYFSKILHLTTKTALSLNAALFKIILPQFFLSRFESGCQSGSSNRAQRYIQCIGKRKDGWFDCVAVDIC